MFLVLGIASVDSSIQFPRTKKDALAIENKAELYKLLDTFEAAYEGKADKNTAPEANDFTKLLAYRYKDKNYVPTGIIINDMQFNPHDQIEFVGFIWQRYFDGIHDSVDRGFILPQATHKTTITEIGRTKHEKAETIMWQVQAQLNQNLSYSAFPFDIKNIKFK